MNLPLPPIVEDLLPHIPDPAGTWLVGGGVRDALLGREVKDVDLTVPGGALELARELARGLDAAFVPLDEERGSARLVLRGSSVVIDVTDFRAPTLEADLAARDFTVNALAVPLAPPHEIVDPLGGLADLGARRLRAPGPEVLEDDPLRGLRAVRFAGELGFLIEEPTRGWIAARASSLASVAAERIREELLRAISSPRPIRVAEELAALGLLEPLFPDRGPSDLSALRSWVAFEGRLADAPPPETRRFASALRARLDRPLGESGTHRGLVRLASLLEPSDARTFQSALEALRLGRSDVRWGGRLIEGFRRLAGDPGDDPVESLAIFRFYRAAGDAGPEAALLAASAGALADESLERLLEAWFDRHSELVDPPILVTGDDLLALGLPPGKRVGEILERIREGQVEGEVETREEGLELARSVLATRNP